eukprot:6056441-Prymnesium_polylepis.1
MRACRQRPLVCQRGRAVAVECVATRESYGRHWRAAPGKRGPWAALIVCGVSASIRRGRVGRIAMLLPLAAAKWGMPWSSARERSDVCSGRWMRHRTRPRRRKAIGSLCVTTCQSRH